MFMSGVTQVFASDLILVGDYIGGEVGFIAPGTMPALSIKFQVRLLQKSQSVLALFSRACLVAGIADPLCRGLLEQHEMASRNLITPTRA